MFWYFLLMELLGFVFGLITYDRQLRGGLTKEEKIYLKSFCRALKEGKYKVKQADDDDE